MLLFFVVDLLLPLLLGQGPLIVQEQIHKPLMTPLIVLLRGRPPSTAGILLVEHAHRHVVCISIIILHILKLLFELIQQRLVVRLYS